MFSRLLHSTRAIFSRQEQPRLNSPSSLNPDQQLQIELAQAVEGGMVATRSQDHTLDDVDVHELVDKTPLSARSKKRKVEAEEDAGFGHGEEKRRKRTSAKSKSDIGTAPSPSGSTRRVALEESLEIGNDVEYKEPPRRDSPTSRFTKAIGSMSTTSKNSHISFPNHDGDKEARMSVANSPRRREAPSALARKDDKEATPDSTRQQATKRRKKPSKDKHVTVENLAEGEALKGKANLGVKREAKLAVKPTKKRFGSEDIEVPFTVPQGSELKDMADEVPSEASSESEDEAPETVTASAGLEKARTKALATAEAIARQKANLKTQRKERDLRLKSQAKSGKQHKNPKEQPSGESVEPDKTGINTTIAEDGQDTQPKARSSVKTPLPALLPDDILAAKPVIRPPAPPPSAKIVPNQKRKLLDVESQSPKDIKRGNVKVRVLQDERASLPPKASQTSKALRESWLAGRRGAKGNIIVPRRRLGGGFVRT